MSVAWSHLLRVDWWESLVGSWRSSQEALPETARLRVDTEGWGSKREIQEFRSVERSDSIRHFGHRRGIGGKGRRRDKFDLS